MDYQDSAKKLDQQINEISLRELKGAKTVKREILCNILSIPIRDLRNTERDIREKLAPICLRNQLSITNVRYKMLCDYFHIPVYYIPKKKKHLKYRILKHLVEVSPKELSTAEIANALDENLQSTSNTLRYYTLYQDSWIGKVSTTRGKQIIYKWTATPLGIEAYNSGEAKLLKQRPYKSPKSKTSLKNEIRKCTPKAITILNVLAPAEFPISSRAIANATNMTIDHVCDTLKNDKYSVSPFFVQIKKEGCDPRYKASKVGIEYYYRQKQVI